jgi:large subunit ribosomal protein L44
MAVSRRLVASAARLPAVAASNLPRFPPEQSLYEKTDVPKPGFNAEAWGATQPPPPSALTAFAHRLGLGTVLSTPEIVQRACTHPSFLHLHRQVYPEAPRPETNAQLSSLGNALMGIFASEFVHASYPYLPTRVWRAAVSAYVGSTPCANVAQEMGAAPLLRWHRIVCLYPDLF